jgi:hypothetical protein
VKTGPEPACRYHSPDRLAGPSPKFQHTFQSSKYKLSDRGDASAILAILRQVEGGMAVAKLCREYRMNPASVYKWHAAYRGMDALMIDQMQSQENKSRRFQRLSADLKMQAHLPKEALGEKRRDHLRGTRNPPRQ